MQTISSDDSITSKDSNRQLRPHVPINYNVTLLKHLHGKPQVRTLDNISISLPVDGLSYKENTDAENTDEEMKQTYHK